MRRMVKVLRNLVKEVPESAPNPYLNFNFIYSKSLWCEALLPRKKSILVILEKKFSTESRIWQMSIKAVMTL